MYRHTGRGQRHTIVTMKRLTAFYFSGTGNTRYITEYLLKKLGTEYECELCDVTRIGDAERLIRGADVLLFAFPIYGSAPPIPMRRFVHGYGELLCEKNVILVETQYFFSGDGAAGLGRTIQKYGAKIVAAETFNMPNNLADIKIFPIKNGQEIAPVLARARKRADKFARKILCGRAHLRGFSVFSHGVGYFCQRKFWWKGEAGKRSRLRVDSDRCVGCGLCVKSCPVQNLRLEEKKAVPLNECVLCYRCVNLCPKKAISLFGEKPPETQYRGPMSEK